MNVIKNCLITNSDAKVLKEYCIDKTSPLYQQYRGFNTSMNLEASEVYNMYFGQVVMISGESKHMYEVVVLLNEHQAIRYGNLKSIDVTLYQYVDIGQKVGVANRYVQIEYLSTYIKNPYSFRINYIQMYKDDPAKLFDDSKSVIEGPEQFYYDQSGLRDLMSEYDGGTPNDNIVFMLSNNKGN